MTGFGKFLAGVALAAGVAAAAQAQAGTKTYDLTFTQLGLTKVVGTGSVTFDDSLLAPNNTVFEAPPPGAVDAFNATFTNVDGLSSVTFDLSDLGFVYLVTNGSGGVSDLGLWSYNFFAGPGDVCNACTTPWMSYVSPLNELVVNPANHEQTDVVVSFTPAPAPEPATWAMLIVGLGLVGLAGRARREGATVAA